jgi:ElaB/YqjD/DUF883 family membrane-anchored ribosome-binding protein
MNVRLMRHTSGGADRRLLFPKSGDLPPTERRRTLRCSLPPVYTPIECRDLSIPIGNKGAANTMTSEAPKKAEPPVDADKIKDLVDQAMEKAEPLVDKALEKAESLVEKAEEKAESLVEKVKEKVEPLVEKVTDSSSSGGDGTS